MFTVNEIPILVKKKDDDKNKFLDHCYFFSVCNGFICFYFNTKYEAMIFCEMLNWLIDKKREKDVYRLHYLIFIKDFKSFSIKKDEYYNEYKQEPSDYPTDCPK